MDLSKNKIADNFSHAAGNYESYADAQRLISNQLSEFLPEKIYLGRILEFGCGTGFLTETLLKRYKTNSVLGIDIAPGMIELCTNKFHGISNCIFAEADIEEVEFDEKFPLITSSATIQWCTNPSGLFKKLKENLAPSAQLCFSVIVKGTFPEYYDSYKEVTGEDISSSFFRDSQVYIEALEKHGFRIIEKKELTHTFYYMNAYKALKSINGIGASFKGHENTRILPPKILSEIIKEYENNYSRDPLHTSLTYKVLYIAAGAG